jgi:hypothetical protein
MALISELDIYKNLKSWLDDATPKHINEGSEWYHNAYKEAESIADECETVNPMQVCGVIAALSAGVQWDVNKRQARALCIAHDQLKNVYGVAISTYKPQLKKAIRILGGEHPDVALGKQAWKTKAFFWNMFFWEDDEHVTIDRHIWRAAGLDGVWITHKRYRMVEKAIKMLAEEVGRLPHQIQAIIWVAVVDGDIPV